MGNEESVKLAQECRRQAGLASTPEVRATLIELAEQYERGPEGSLLGAVKSPTKQVE